MTFSVRAFEPEDEPGIVELWRASGLIVPWNDPCKDILRKIGLNPEWFLVGEIDGKIVASCMAGYDGHRGGINYLAVHPDYQRNGFAGKMMARAEELLIEAGCPKVNLLVRTTNRSVISFYEKIGYSDNECLSLGKKLIPDD